MNVIERETQKESKSKRRTLGIVPETYVQMRGGFGRLVHGVQGRAIGSKF